MAIKQILMNRDNDDKNKTRRIGNGLIVGAWILLLALLTLVFSNIIDYQHNPNRVVEVVTDGKGMSEVVLIRNKTGHYVATGKINGRPVVFLVDTGATDVAVPESLAEELGLKRGVRVSSMTANGTVLSWQTRLDEVALGAIRLRDVRGSILPTMRGDAVLLGMSFLRELELLQRGNRLILRQY